LTDPSSMPCAASLFSTSVLATESVRHCSAVTFCQAVESTPGTALSSTLTCSGPKYHAAQQRGQGQVKPS
jgi:hypothetical protein